jgi:hypothetical protein
MRMSHTTTATDSAMSSVAADGSAKLAEWRTYQGAAQAPRKSDRDGAAAGRLRVGVHHAGIVYILVKESLVFFSAGAAVDFLTDTQWTPLFSMRTSASWC